jgi:AcrR family transcriptional regulator
MYTDVPMTARDHTHVLPRGRHAAPREIVWVSQRDRMLAAMAEAVADKGYAGTAVADVIAGAGVSRKTFYEQFANKEACFLAAYDAGVGLLLGAIDEAIRTAEGGPLDAARAGTRCYLEMLAANPALARTFLLEVTAAGPAARERHAAVHERFAEQLRAVHTALRAELEGLEEPPPYTFRACVGAVHELVVDELRRTGPEALPGLVDAVFDVELRLLVGPAGPGRR